MTETHQHGEVRTPIAAPDARRKFPRVPFVTAVEIQTAHSVEYGFSENISVGGMLVRSSAALEPMDPALVSFVLRGIGRMQIESRIVHCRPGVRTGIEFLHLTDQQREALTLFSQPKIETPRRSARIPMRLFLEISWVDRGQLLEGLVETVLISRHGCLVLTKANLKVGRDISLRWPEAGIDARARIVSRQDCAADLPRVAMEFSDTDSFWGSLFPAEA